MKKIVTLLIVVSFMLASCYPHVHVIGSGGTGSDTQTQKQWHAIMGLISINHVDTKEMAAEATDYTIKTKQKFVDSLIAGLTFGLVTPRTVEVTK